MNTYLISPPFGNYIHLKGFTNVLGSFTWEYRPGLIWNALKYFRPVEGGFVNKQQLANKGIRNVEFNNRDIFSVVGFNDGDWIQIYSHIIYNIIKNKLGKIILEINLGCPNTNEYGILPPTLKMMAESSYVDVIVKLPANYAYKEIACMAVECGVKYLHFSNTLPSARGGISGKQLYVANLPMVSWASEALKDVNIIAGGGITSIDNINAYRRAGATYFSLSTVFLNPIKAYRLIRSINDSFGRI